MVRIGGGRAGGRRIAGRHRARHGEQGFRPTSSKVRGAMFSMLGPGGVEQKSVLDLYAGTGVLGLEALSRGAARSEFVEISSERCRDIKLAADELGFGEQVLVHRGPAERVTKTLPGRYDIVFIDPPYGADPFKQIFENLSSASVLNENAVVFAEHSVKTALEDSYPGLRLHNRRRYGGTVVSVYRAAAPDGERTDLEPKG